MNKTEQEMKRGRKIDKRLFQEPKYKSKKKLSRNKKKKL